MSWAFFDIKITTTPDIKIGVDMRIIKSLQFKDWRSGAKRNVRKYVKVPPDTQNVPNIINIIPLLFRGASSAINLK